jgi:hypothetical protein
VHAFVDESARVAAPGLYVVAGVIIPMDGLADVRSDVRAAVPHRQLRFHWRDEQEMRRREFVKHVAQLDLTSVVVAGSPLTANRQERARRHCLQRLLWELGERGVTEVVLESRDEPLNQRDRQVIEAGKRANRIRKGLRYSFARPKEEPLLWLPDALAGAVTTAAAGDPEYLTTFGTAVTRVDIELG